NDHAGALPPDLDIVPGDVIAADLEGTLTDGETWRGLGRWLSTHGRAGEYRRFLAVRLPLLPVVRVGLVDRQAFRDRWIRDLVGRLAGASRVDVEAVAEWIVEHELWPARRAALLAQLTEVRDRGARVVVVSGTYAPVLDRFCARAGFEAVGTPLEFDGDRFTGRLAGPVNTGPRKLDRLARRIGTAPLRRAYGDSTADTALLAASADPVAVTPDRALARTARERGWRIVDPQGAPVTDPLRQPS
ncbi:MAG: HAD-IB family phosphatase, partial [Chloroflexi bacterium]|nr:HAD-IB family phosphatase [Chloroflexota bacterium]